MSRPFPLGRVGSLAARLATGGRFRYLPSAGAEAPVLALLLVSLTLFDPSGAPASPPATFIDTQVIASLGAPTDVAFLPKGRILVTSQEGRLYTSNGGGKTTVYTVPQTRADYERGLLGVAVDPLFGSNSFIYLHYTYPAFGTCIDNSGQSPVNRVSHFTFNGSTNTVNAGSETVIVDNMPSPNGNDNAGDIGFGKDGYLYVAVGDGSCDLTNSNLCGGQNTSARRENILTGKILRVTRDGGIPPGNPFTGADTGVCGDDGRTSTARCRETWAWGFRSPFRFAFDPNASGVRLYANDVGKGTWEKIDNVVPGADYGWNTREGFCANGSTTNCGAPPSALTNPVYAYQHGSCNSITDGDTTADGNRGTDRNSHPGGDAR